MLLKFHAAPFVRISILFSHLQRTMQGGTPEEKALILKGSSIAEPLKKNLLELNQLCKESALRSSHRQLGRIIGLYDDDLTREQCSSLLADLGLRINDDLEETLLLCVETAKAPYYEKALSEFGDEVVKVFGKASEDIEEASKCFALGRDTACVYHCMRIAEHGLRRMANAFQIPFSRVADSSWGPVIDEIEGKIRDAERQPKKSAQLKRKLQFYADAAVQMRHFKLAWRNSVSHTKASYKPEKAKEIFDSVRFFMRHLSTNRRKKINKKSESLPANLLTKGLFGLGMINAAGPVAPTLLTEGIPRKETP